MGWVGGGHVVMIVKACGEGNQEELFGTGLDNQEITLPFTSTTVILEPGTREEGSGHTLIFDLSSRRNDGITYQIC